MSMPERVNDENIEYRNWAWSRSSRMAVPTPGYWTLTATTRPSAITARWTCPIDAAATGSGSQSRNSSSGGAPSSSHTTWSARLGAIGGTSCWSWASASRAAGGRPSATKPSIWPSFMAAPFIWPSSVATSSALRMVNLSSRAARRSAPRALPLTFTLTHPRPRRAVRRQTLVRRRQRCTRSPSDAPDGPMASAVVKRARRGRGCRGRRSGDGGIRGRCAWPRCRAPPRRGPLRARSPRGSRGRPHR